MPIFFLIWLLFGPAFEQFYSVVLTVSFVCIARFKNIPTKIPAGSRLVFDWNPCTNVSEGFGCKNVLVSSLNF